MSGALRIVGRRWRAAMALAVPWLGAACTFPDVSYFASDAAQPVATEATTSPEPSGVDSGDSSDPQGVGVSSEAGSASGDASGPPGKAHDASAIEAGPRGDGGVDCLCDASHMYRANVDCSGVTLGGIHLLCGDFAGFVGNDPGCGNPGSFVTCTAGLVVACMAGTPSVVVQQCH